MRSLFTLGLVLGLHAFMGSSLGQEPKPDLEAAYRKWDKGLSSAEKDVQVKTLLDMLPTKDEVKYLFPKHVEKLWPNIEKGTKVLKENVQSIAKEFTRGGEIKKVKAIDVRKDDERASGAYKELLAIIPMDVMVFEMVVERAKVTSGGGTYLYSKGRWFWIKNLDSVPAFLDKL